ncbi:Glycerophosphocholine phosphodiesterase gpcpd1-like protein [Dirofilaria immitis]|nr:Glycerophosphocholine phosphodiesterase gpcpd1-like protein [Dirofilaria immitis]
MSIAPRIILHFSVEVETVRPWEYVFVTGSMPALGSWMPSDAFLLYPDPDSARQRWEGAVEVESDPVKFRYFIGYYLNSGKEEEKMNWSLVNGNHFYIPDPFCQLLNRFLACVICMLLISLDGIAGSIDDDDNEESQDLTQPVVPSYSVAHIAINASGANVPVGIGSSVNVL